MSGSNRGEACVSFDSNKAAAAQQDSIAVAEADWLCHSEHIHRFLPPKAPMNDAPLYAFTLDRLDGGALPLSDYRGQVLLLVNTASQCGFTGQYAGLEALYRQYGPRGLVVIGCPCNQFGRQEPGDAADIGAFCQRNYGVSFPLSAKLEVNGDGAHPLWQHLKAAQPGVLGSQAIKWNFTKFLVNRQGEVVARYAPQTTPEALAADIEALL